jgi:hypothetical protein
MPNPGKREMGGSAIRSMNEPSDPVFSPLRFLLREFSLANLTKQNRCQAACGRRQQTARPDDCGGLDFLGCGKSSAVGESTLRVRMGRAKAKPIERSVQGRWVSRRAHPIRATSYSVPRNIKLFFPPPSAREARGGEGSGVLRQPHWLMDSRKDPPPPTPPRRFAEGGAKSAPGYASLTRRAARVANFLSI